MIRCPNCGADTVVTETRRLRNASRRRRACTKCNTRVTTMEVPVGAQRLPHDGPLLIIRERDIMALRDAVASLLPAPEPEPAPESAPDADPPAEPEP